MNDLPEPDEDVIPPAPRKTSGLAWGCVILFLIMLIVDLVGISMLGKNANNTFSNIRGVTDAPVKHPVPSQK